MFEKDLSFTKLAGDSDAVVEATKEAEQALAKVSEVHNPNSDCTGAASGKECA